MCTVSWTRTNTGYEVFFNRDEKRTRMEGEPPRVWDDPRVKTLAPRDPQGGGTWLFVNEHGLAACVMNAYDSEPGDVSGVFWSSRGKLLLQLAAADALGELRQRLSRALQKARYRPGFVLAWDRAGAGRCWSWERNALEDLGEPPRPMLATSSFDSRQVIAARRAAFRRICGPDVSSPDPDALRRFHLAEDQAPDAYTVRMSREDARTVSLTQIRVTNGVARMAYAPRQNDAGFARPSVHVLKLY